jgi:micrococcal nuclease
MRITARERRALRSRQVLITATVISAILGAALVVRWSVLTLLHTSTEPFAAEPTVVKVIDGDTIDVRLGRSVTRIRLLGIDTPETKDPRRPVQCFGPEASRRTAELLPEGTVVHLESDRETHDAFGRTLAYVHRDDGLFVNLSLVVDGYADVLTIAPNGAHSAEFTAAAAAARAAPIGLWATCGGPGRPLGTGTAGTGR